MNLGGFYKDLGNLDEALKSTLKSLELKPDNPTAYVNLGIIYKDQGQVSKSEDCSRKALQLNPNQDNAHQLLASVLFMNGKYNEALKEERLSGGMIMFRLGDGISLLKE